MTYNKGFSVLWVSACQNSARSSIQLSPLSGQAWQSYTWRPLHRHRANSSSQKTQASTRSPTSASCDDAVHAAFAEAGLSEKVIDKVLSSYPPYLRWDVEGKLRPALQQWHEDLGSTKLSDRLQWCPKLLISKPSEANEIFLWLTSLGINAERLQHKAPRIFTRNLAAVQSTVCVFQQVAGFSDAQLPALFHRHFEALRLRPHRRMQSLECIAGLLAVPIASEELRSAVMASQDRLFKTTPAVLQDRIKRFCATFGVTTGCARRALQAGVSTVTSDEVEARASKLQGLLGWRQPQLKKFVSTKPVLLLLTPERIATNMRQLQEHGFAASQVTNMCSRQTTLLTRNWSSAINVEKLAFLTTLLGVTTANDIAAEPHYLMYSLDNRVGPRLGFLFQHSFIASFRHASLRGHLVSVLHLTDAKFASKYSSSSTGAYDKAFIDHWKQRWTFLRQRMLLPVETIAAHEELLRASLPDDLAPRWHVLTQLAAKRAGFRAEDHLQAMANMSDADFAKAFGTVGLELI